MGGRRKGAVAVALAAAVVLAPAAWAAELVKYEIVDDRIPASLTGQPGDPAKGRKIAVTRSLGNCLACHKMPIPDELFHGEVAPDLAGVGSRYDEGELRLRLVNPKAINPDTMMPSFYRVDGLHRVMKKFQGKPILTAAQVEDLIAYLKTLKEQ